MLHFGLVGYQQLRENMRILYVKLSDNFLNHHQLSYQQDLDFAGVQTEPLTKPNFAQMSKMAQVEKATFQQVLLNIFQVIGELLGENPMVDIDLGELGKFCANHRQIVYDPYNKLRPQAP